VSTSPARYFPGILARRAPAQDHETDAADEGAIAHVDADETAEDEALIVRLQDKDIEALGLLYRRYARLVYSICLRILKNATEAEDLVHEVFLCLYRKCKSFDAAKGAARPWIIQLAYSRCFDWRDYMTVRSRHQQDEEHIENRPAEELYGKQDTDPAYLVLWNPRMLAAFKSLSEEQQAALQLFYFQGFTFQEIAEEQGYSYGNAKHHVYRGIARLRSIVFDGRQAKSASVPELKCGPQEPA
jgi:RNA polymerase sigma-70 factor, ECF subfamily